VSARGAAAGLSQRVADVEEALRNLRRLPGAVVPPPAAEVTVVTPAATAAEVSLSTLWWDADQDDYNWPWTAPVIAPDRAVVPLTHFAHHGPNEPASVVGGDDGNSPAYIYQPDDTFALYHVEGLVLGTFGAGTAGPLRVSWSIGEYPTGSTGTVGFGSNGGVDDVVSLSPNTQWSSRVSGDVVFGNTLADGYVVSPILRSSVAATRNFVTVLKAVITARRLSSWPPLP